MIKKPSPEKLTISTNHWKVPSEENALDGVVEGRPTEERVAEAREQARQERAVWKPNQEALDLVEKLKAFIGFRVRVQFWDSIMFMLDDVPEPVWYWSIGNWSRCAPPMTSSAAATTASATS